METENKEKYHVGQHIDAFIDCGWEACLVTSVKASQPPSYGIVTIEKGKNFYLSPDSLRHRTDRYMLVQESFQEHPAEVQQHNLSVFSSDDESLFITPSNVAEDSLNLDKEDSLLDFAKETEEFLTLTASPTPRTSSPSVNRCQPLQRPSTEQCVTGSSVHSNFVSDIDENCVPDDYELDEALALVDEEFLTTPQDQQLEDNGDSHNHEVSKKSNVRFAEVDDQAIQNLQKAAKSDRTHKQTTWAIKILTG